MLRDHLELSSIVNDIAQKCANATSLGYFDCLAAMDTLEFYILDGVDPETANSTITPLTAQATTLHRQLSLTVQTIINNLIQDIYTQRHSPPVLKQLLNDYANSVPDKRSGGAPDYDFFDDLLNDLFYVNYQPSETLRRMGEMFYLQPTPGRVILEMLNTLPFTNADRFYDLGSGLGYIPIVVALLTEAYAVGIEYEPTYTHYAQQIAQKLAITTVEFRNQDAQDADFSDGTIFFMYTPFVGSILRKVLNRLHELSKQHPIVICTYGPCTPIVAQEAWLYPLRAVTGEIYRLAIFRSDLSR